MTATVFRQSYMTQHPSLFTLVSYCAIVFSFALMFADGWFTAVVLKLFLIAYHLWLPYYHHVPPCSRKSQCAKYYSIKSLENQNRHKCNVNKIAVRNF